MRSILRILALLLVLLLLLLPLAAQAEGPCPDDPELSKDCDPDTPPFYVVINRSFEDLDRVGSGCQPIILDFPDCIDCCDEDEDCADARDYLEEEVCPMLADERVDWDEEDEPVVLYEMCCDCATDPDGEWRYTERELYEDGTCPIALDENEEPLECIEGLPPGTGIDLPAPVIIGGLAIIGAVMLGAGLLVRRRTLRVA
jgi:hypothetical protein